MVFQLTLVHHINFFTFKIGGGMQKGTKSQQKHGMTLNMWAMSRPLASNYCLTETQNSTISKCVAADT